MKNTLQEPYGIIRFVFGLVWLIDASLKWLPHFQNDVPGAIGEALAGQSPLIHAWIQLWVDMSTAYPTLFGIGIGTTETLLALALISGILARPAIVFGFVFSLFVWSIPQGFGGPYTAESTNIDSGFIYALVFALLWFTRSWETFSVMSFFKKA